jgi:hypothetical protein
MIMSRNHLILAGATVLVAATGIGWKVLNTPPPPPPSVDSVAPPELLAAAADARRGKTQATAIVVGAKVSEGQEQSLERIGLNTLVVRMKNGTKDSFPISYKAGEIFEGTKAQVVLLKSFTTNVPPGGAETHELPIAAIRSADPVGGGNFTSASRTKSALEPLIRHLESNPEIPIGTVQTAVLAILEDAPVDLFAKFPRLKVPDGGAVKSFKVDTVQIIAALQLLRDIGVHSCQLSADPQLKVEAMLDLKAHALAKEFYGIDSESEWLYWKHELLEGQPSTRHYALYGIARFYPDVALQMMPKWVLEQRISPHYRQAAIGALAYTGKPEASSILRALERDLLQEKNLAQEVGPALAFLSERIDAAP